MIMPPVHSLHQSTLHLNQPMDNNKLYRKTGTCISRSTWTRMTPKDDNHKKRYTSNNDIYASVLSLNHDYTDITSTPTQVTSSDPVYSNVTSPFIVSSSKLTGASTRPRPPSKIVHVPPKQHKLASASNPNVKQAAPFVVKSPTSQTSEFKPIAPDQQISTLKTPLFPIHKPLERSYPVYTQLLNNISRDLDVMLRDLCHHVPYRSVTAASRDHGLPYFYPKQLQIQKETTRQIQRKTTSCLEDLKRQMGLLEQHSSVPASSSDDVTSTSSEEYYSLDENSDVFHEDSASCSPDVFDSHDNIHFLQAGERNYEPPQPQPYQPSDRLSPLGEIIQITLLERITKTRPIWHLPELGRAGAVHLLHSRQSGVFVVRQSSKMGCLALSVRVGERPSIEHYIIELAKRGLRLENSYHYFKELILLIKYYAQNLDELPVKLDLPQVLKEATTHHQLNSYALMGQDFWSSLFSERSHLQFYNTNITLSPQQPRRCSLPFQTSVSVQTSQHQSLHSRRVQSASQRKANRTLGHPAKYANNNSHIRPTELNLQHNSSGKNVHRQSLTQINHSITSPFTEVSQDISKRHDYVNVTNMEGSAHLFRPISTEINDVVIPETKVVPAYTIEEQSDQKVKEDMVKDIEKEIESLANMETDFKSVNCKTDGLDFPEITDYLDTSDKADNPSLRVKTRNSHKVATKHLSLIPTYKPNEPVVFTFDLTPGSSNNTNNRRQGFLHVPPQYGGTQPSPLSAKTQYSSPAYTEPFDTLIGKIEGVTQTKGAINVNTFLRQTLANKAKCDEIDHPMTDKWVEETTGAHHILGVGVPQTTRVGVPRTTGAVHGASTFCDVIQSSPKDITVSKSDTYITGALDSSLTCNPRYKVSLEEIPLSPQTLHNSERQCKSAERSFSLKSLERNNNVVCRKSGVRAQSLPRDVPESLSPRDVPEPLHQKPPKGNTHHTVVMRDQNNQKPQRNSFRSSMLSNCFEENLFSSPNMTVGKEENMSSTIYRQFPTVNKLNSKRSSMSDSSTLEDILSSLSPELTLEPINPLTERNVNRISEYDNFCSGFCNHESGRAVSSRRTAVVSSVGTHYSQPWENSLWYNLLKKQSSQKQTAEIHDDRGSLYVDSDGLSQLGSDIACSTFEWHKKPDRDSATETTPQPPLFDDIIHPVMYTGRMAYPPSLHSDNPVQTMVETTLSDDEGVSVEELIMDTAPAKSAPKLIGMASRGSNTPGGKLENYVSGLAEKAETIFGSHVDRFVKCTLEGHEINPHTVLRNVRQFMNGIKNYLVQHGEKQLNELIETERNRLGQDEFLNVDAILETSLHKCVVKPLKTHIYKLFLAYYQNCGQLEELSDSIKYARTKTPQELGIRTNIQPPSGSSMELIKDYLSKMQKAFSPLHKLENLLGATSTMVGSVQSYDRGSVSSQDTNTSLATDDLLPMLIYVLVQCGVVTAEIEADYMWGLLHPCVLAGEGGYYLTTFSSAVHLLKNLKGAMEATPGEVRFPSLGDLQGFMKIIIPDEKHNSIITKTLPVRPSMTTKDVCSMIAHRFRITNPQDYGLYVLVMGIEDRLCDSSCPQQMKAKLQKDRRQSVFAYKRNNAKFAWPVHFK